MKQLHAIWLVITTGVAGLTELGQMLIDGTKVKFRSAPGPAGIRTVLDDSDIRSSLGGNETDKVPSVQAVSTAVSNATLTVNPNSTPYLRIVAGQIEARPLLVTRPVIDSVSTSLTLALAAQSTPYNAANVGNGTALLQEGDFLILPAHTGGIRVFLHNGGTAGGVGDFTLVEQPSFDSATIRALFTATNGLSYDNLTGQFKLGGALSENTAIDSSGRNIIFSNSAGGNVGVWNDGVTNQVRIGHAGGFFYATNNDMGLVIGSSANAGAGIIDDKRGGLSQTGLRYLVDLSAKFTARSLVDKGYVDAQILANTLGKSSQTINTTANTWTNVVHGFNLPVGQFDNLLFNAYDATGELTGLRMKAIDKDTIQVLTTDAVTGLRVRMAKL